MRRAWGEPADYRLPDHLVIHRQDPYTAFWSDVNPPAYSPGTLVGRWSKSGTQVCPGNTIMAQSTLTRLTFIAADGTETELVDELTGGTPKSDNTCSSPDPNQTCSVAALCRGTVFVARDGSAMRFVADAGISDTTVLTWDQFTVAGTLYFRNGIRYKIDSYGRVRIITDRNGNQVNLDYDEDGDLIHVRDSANRDITIAHSLSVDTITYPGRPDIRINKSAISSALDSNRTCVLPTCEMPSPYDIFGTYGGSSTPIDIVVINSIALPNGRSYSFLYNDYAELSQVTLPTGGKFRYTWGSATESYSVIDSAGNPYVYRRVRSRDVYPDGARLEQHTVFSDSYGTGSQRGNILDYRYHSLPL